MTRLHPFQRDARRGDHDSARLLRAMAEEMPRPGELPDFLETYELPRAPRDPLGGEPGFADEFAPWDFADDDDASNPAEWENLAMPRQSEGHYEWHPIDEGAKDGNGHALRCSGNTTHSGRWDKRTL